MILPINILRRIAVLLAGAVAAVSCNVHEWPGEPRHEQLLLKLRFDTDFTQWDHTFDGQQIAATGRTATVGGERTYGWLHHLVRAYPLVNGEPQEGQFSEFTFAREASAGYDCDLTVDLAPGKYAVMVWTTLSAEQGDAAFYDASDFDRICLTGDHAANTDFRDAFRGTGETEIDPRVIQYIPATLKVAMERPLAKYEFVATDLDAFLAVMTARAAKAANGANGANGAGGAEEATRASADDYEAVIRYPQFMPNAYSLFIDKPVDSSTGVSYRSGLVQRSAQEASAGFDYVFVNGSAASVAVQIEVRKRGEEQVIARSKTLLVPLQRNRWTVVRGAFLTLGIADEPGSSGGVGVDPGFDGDFNITVPN